MKDFACNMVAHPVKGLPLLSALLLGFFSILSQTLIVRALLSVFSGNELIIGLVLSLWIAFTSAGSIICLRLKPERFTIALGFALSGPLVQVLLALSWYVYPLSGLSFGEVIPLYKSMFFIVILLFPLCFIYGALFPLVVRYFSLSPSFVYGLESLGAFLAGGTFSLFFAGTVPDRLLVLFLSLFSMALSVWIAGRRVLLPLIVIPLVMHIFLPDSTKEVMAGQIVQRDYSKEGEVIITEREGQKNLYVSGKHLFSFPEPRSEEILTHIPVLFSRPDRVLIIGGSPLLALKFRSYSSSRVTYLQFNKRVLELTLKELKERQRSLFKESSWLRPVTEDARAYLKRTDELYDIIILNSAFPTTASLNRFYTMEFFRLVKKHLSSEGVFCLSLMAVPGYMSEEMALANSTIYRTVKSIFPHVRTTSMEYALLLASTRPIGLNQKRLDTLFKAPSLSLRYLDSSIIEDMFSPLKRERFERLLLEGRQLNTDRHPVSYLYNVLLWAETHGGGWMKLVLKNPLISLLMIVLLLGLVVLSTACSVRKAEASVLFSIGFTTLSVVTLSAFVYQSIRGYIYEMIGLLTALYMLGSALGAIGIERLGNAKRRLPVILSLFILLLGMYLFFSKTEAGLFLMVLLFGVMGGALFGVSAAAIERVEIAYALDLAGAFFGALTVTLFLFPLFGLNYTVGFLVYLNLLSLLLVLKRGIKRGI